VRLDEGADLFKQARQQWNVSKNATLITGRLLVRFPADGQDLLTLYEHALDNAHKHNNQHEIAYCCNGQRLIGVREQR
jgi:hypothetical protein